MHYTVISILTYALLNAAALADAPAVSSSSSVSDAPDASIQLLTAELVASGNDNPSTEV